jgi:hypothetical protein
MGIQPQAQPRGKAIQPSILQIPQLTDFTCKPQSTGQATTFPMGRRPLLRFRDVHPYHPLAPGKNQEALMSL